MASSENSSSGSSRSSGGSSRRRSGRFAKETAPLAEAREGSAAPAPASPMVEAFRGTTRRRPVHSLERALLWIVAIHLVLLPWPLGSMLLWTQIASCALGAVAFVVALLPRRVVAEQRGEDDVRLLTYPRLLRFPIFWLGLGLFALITIQGLNPAWEFTTNTKFWWMRAIPHITWLPSGVRAPMQQTPGLPQGGEWRNLIIYAGAWLTTCAVWVGLTRRRTLQRLFLILCFNGLALALVGVAQRLLGVTKIFGFIHSNNPSFFSSFVYKNFAGGYLLLMLGVTCGLGGWHYARSVRRMDKSSPAGVFVFFTACQAIAMLISYARGATFVMLIFLCLVVIAYILYQFRLPTAARNPVITSAFVGMFTVFLLIGLYALNFGDAWQRLTHALSGEDLSVHAREVANQASLQMLGDHWGLGVGSGAFQWLFTLYQQRFPDIAHNQFWMHAHNDLLEFPIDLGVPGMLLILGSFAFYAVALIRRRAWQNALSGSVLLGCLAVLGMASGDFVFQCPAILTTWCVLWAAATRWAEVERA